MPSIAHQKPLFFNKRQHRLRHLDLPHFAVRLGHDVVVRNAAEPRIHKPAEPVGNLRARFPLQILRRDPEQRRLHGSGRNFHRLQKERANGQGYRHRHQNDLHILADSRMREGLQPVPRRFIQLLHALQDDVSGSATAQGQAQFLGGFLDGVDGLGRQQILLGLEQLQDVFAQLAGLPNGARKKPAKNHNLCL
jgi:hypothetical protein